MKTATAGEIRFRLSAVVHHIGLTVRQWESFQTLGLGPPRKPNHLASGILLGVYASWKLALILFKPWLWLSGECFSRYHANISGKSSNKGWALLQHSAMCYLTPYFRYAYWQWAVRGFRHVAA